MSLFSLLRKPAWEHRDASRRAAAVASETQPELLAKLPDLARNDPEASVRLAAIRRIDDLSLLGDRMRNDAEAGVRNVARQRFIQRLLDTAVPLAERERVIAVEEDADILATLAQQAPEASLRRIGLERVARPGLIAERCVKDPDPELRRWLLDRIDDTATLERIAERARKTDKLLARTARERAFATRLAAGDPAATMDRALAICEELDTLRRDVAPDAAMRRDELAQEWATLRPRLDAAMERRVDGYFAALEHALNPPSPTPPQEPEQEPEAEAAAPVTSPVAREPDAALAALVVELDARAERLGPRDLEDFEKRWSARVRRIEPLLPEEQRQAERFRATASMLQQRFAERARQRQAALDGLSGQIEALEAAVSAGQVATARDLQRAIDADRNLLREQFPRSIARRFAEAARELENLGKWQHWSNNKARLRLIDDTEALAGSGHHPDAVAAKVKELQAEWQQLNDTEARAPEAPEHPLTRRFRAACHRVLAPARPYFEKRRELRGARREEIEAFLTELEARASERVPIRELITARRQVVDQLRLSDELDPAARRELGHRLRDALARLDAAIGELEAEADATKRKLLANLRRDLMHADLAAALPIARQAQATWKTLPRAARRVEDALWKELLELVDPWFNQADAKQRERHESESAVAGEARGILDELARLAADDVAMAQAEMRLAALHTRWRALAERLPAAEETPLPRHQKGVRPPRAAPRAGLDERAFDRAVASVRDAMARYAETARRDELARLLQASNICDQLDVLPADASEARREELEHTLEALDLASDARAACGQRMHTAPDARLALDANESSPQQRAEELIVLAELACGIASPEESRELRRRLQIARLSERLSGAADAGPDAVRPLLIDYLGLTGVPVPARQALAPRWAAVVEAG
ncbi:hypothetical protein OS176_00205 [Xanthomonadaceae bacterium XH05]|nr:hypothetical protein [Xanthomonadaceae bacterium XH05]